ncbi:MAG: hypothetical protein CYPHOPRED_002860 [Cyphobasidiales sp. Tagirdzhanova-0007]|nr:MAG: hypothetical protein CYPHOPRED_002860 [Cyphobasidiales sp. Tagirdzhanova-0007]
MRMAFEDLSRGQVSNTSKQGMTDGQTTVTEDDNTLEFSNKNGLSPAVTRPQELQGLPKPLQPSIGSISDYDGFRTQASAVSTNSITRPVAAAARSVATESMAPDPLAQLDMPRAEWHQQDAVTELPGEQPISVDVPALHPVSEVRVALGEVIAEQGDNSEESIQPAEAVRNLVPVQKWEVQEESDKDDDASLPKIVMSDSEEDDASNEELG